MLQKYFREMICFRYSFATNSSRPGGNGDGAGKSVKDRGTGKE